MNARLQESQAALQETLVLERTTRPSRPRPRSARVVLAGRATETWVAQVMERLAKKGYVIEAPSAETEERDMLDKLARQGFRVHRDTAALK